MQLNYAYSADRVTKRSVTKRYFLQPRIRKSILKCRISELFTFHLKYHPWGLINDMQMRIYNRKNWQALSHSPHFVRHEGSLATIGRTRLTRSMASHEPGFLYTRCGTSSSSYSGMFSGWPARWSLVLVHLLVLRMTAGPSHLVWSVFVSSGLRGCRSSHCLVGFRFFRFTGLSKFSFTKFRFALCSPPVTVKVLFVPVNSTVGGSIARLCSNSVGRRNPKLFNL